MWSKGPRSLRAPLNGVFGVKMWDLGESSFFLFFCLWTFSCCSTISWKAYPFSTELCSHLCWKSVGSISVGLFLGSLLCCTNLCLLCQYHNVAITVAIQWVIKSDRLIPSTSFSSKFSNSSLRAFHRSFRIILPTEKRVCVKHVYQFVENWHLYHSESSSDEHSMPIYLNLYLYCVIFSM